jgi:hypothetical protein
MFRGYQSFSSGAMKSDSALPKILHAGFLLRERIHKISEKKE